MKKRKGKRKSLVEKVTRRSLQMFLATFFLMSLLSTGSLLFMKKIFTEFSKSLGQTAAEDVELALKDVTTDHLLDIATEKSRYIEKSLSEISAYVHGIASAAEDIYAHPGEYPLREPKASKQKEGSVRLLRSESLAKIPPGKNKEIQRLWNIKDLLVQYNNNNDMVSSSYLAAKTGWTIQADDIPIDNDADADYFESSAYAWYQDTMQAEDDRLCTFFIQDFHGKGDCIVYCEPVYRGEEAAAVAGIVSYLTDIRDVILDTSIGKSGYAFLMNEKGQIMVSPKETGETAGTPDSGRDIRKGGNPAFAAVAKRMVKGKRGIKKLTLDGQKMLIAYTPLKSFGWSIAAAIDVAEVTAPAKESQKVILDLTENASKQQETAIVRILLIFLFLLAVAMPTITALSVFFIRKAINPIRRLPAEIARIKGDSLDYRIEISSRDEIEDLGNAFNDMAAQLQEYVKDLAQVTSEKERISTELMIATQIQANMLPNHFPAFPEHEEIDIFATMTPAKEVGGDFYDFFLVDDTHLAIVIADVSGKGVPAALFMVIGKTLIKEHTKAEVSLGSVFTEVNQILCESNQEGLFITAFEGVLDLVTGKLSYVNAGHEPLFITDSAGYYRPYKTESGFVLAGMEGIRYREGEIWLNPGDRIFLYTDGVTETENRQELFYGRKRLENALNAGRCLELTRLLPAIKADIDRFADGAEQSDDITMLCLAFRKKLPAKVPITEQVSIRAEIPLLENVISFVGSFLGRIGCGGKIRHQFELAAEEIYVNICKYAYPEEAGEVTIHAALTGHSILFTFIDAGIPYNPLERAAPDITLGADKREAGGLGIFLVKNIMDQATYRYDNGRNHLTIQKQRCETPAEYTGGS